MCSVSTRAGFMWVSVVDLFIECNLDAVELITAHSKCFGSRRGNWCMGNCLLSDW